MPKLLVEPDVMLAFRYGTHDLHVLIESTPLFSCLMTDEVSRSDYVNALQGLHQFYSEIEPILIVGIEKFLPDYSYTPRLNLLDRDLSSLGLAIDSKHPDCRPSQPSMTETLGMLYVVEGSTLGGQIISRHLQDKLGVHLRDAMVFYTLDGNLNPNHWGQIKSLFRENLISRSEIEDSINTARKMFQKLLSISKARNL